MVFIFFWYSPFKRTDQRKQFEKISKGGKSMKRITMLMCVLFLMGGSAYAQQNDPRGVEGSQIQQGGSQQGGSRMGPPADAFKACEGKTAGSAAQFTGPNGETVTGTCRMDGEKLVLRPDRSGGNSRDGRRGPPAEAYIACEGKSAGSTAQFVDPRGETLIGKCEEENGKLVLRPDAKKSKRQGQANDGTGGGRFER
jgi:hypothetical protein